MSQTQYELTEECYKGTVYHLHCSICVYTLIKTIEDKIMKCMGYVAEKTLSPRHWFQFADDTAIVRALEEDNQHLFDLFTKWSSWAHLEIWVDKCHSFGVKKIYFISNSIPTESRYKWRKNSTYRKRGKF